MLDELAALRLQLDWGVDEALGDTPVDRLSAVAAVREPMARGATTVPTPSCRPSSRSPAHPDFTPNSAPNAGPLPDLAAVHAALDGFRAHPLRATASCTVPVGGNTAADLVVIAEAPAADDDRSGKAWSGRAGAVLDRVMGSAGLGRDDAALCFLVPWRPPGGRAPTEAEIALALPFLHRTLALLQPRHLLILGDAALRTLVDPEASLRGSRGKWMQAALPGLPAPVPALPILGADRWLQTANSRQATWSDFLTLREAVSKG